MAVRQQIAMSLAEHDAETAFSIFYYDTQIARSQTPSSVKHTSSRDPWFETQTRDDGGRRQIAPKAAQFAARSLDQGFNSQPRRAIEKATPRRILIRAADFGAAILSKIKSDKIDGDDFYAANYAA